MATFQPRIDRPVGRQSGGLAQAARRPSSRKCRFDATGDAASAAREPPQAGEGRKRDPHPAGEAEDFSRIRDVGKSARKVEKFLMVKYNRPNLDATQPPDFDGGDRLPSRTNLSNSAFTERGRSSGVEHNLAKVGVEGSNPFARSSFQTYFRYPKRTSCDDVARRFRAPSHPGAVTCPWDSFITSAECLARGGAAAPGGDACNPGAGAARQPRSVAPVALATAATIFAETASISASVRLASRGCRVTATASDTFPSGSFSPA